MKDKMMSSITWLAQKMGAQIHLSSMRDAFITLIPFLVLAGLMILVNNVLIKPDGFMSAVISPEILTSWQTVGNKVVNGTMNILAMLIGVLISYNLARKRRFVNPLMPAIVTIACMFVLMPTSLAIIPVDATTEVVVTGVAGYSFLGANGTFVAIITAILATEFFIFVCKSERLQIKLEGNIPPAVTQSFNMLFAVMIVVLTFALSSYLIVSLTGFEIHDLINAIIQAPLLGLTTSLPGFILLDIINNFLFALGIHPGGITGAIIEPTLLVAMQQNMDAFANGLDIPNIIVRPFSDLYGRMGGTGITLCLLIAVFIKSKRQELRAFSKVTIPTSIFNINEPVIFGFPIVFNPILMIPFTFIPSILYVIAYFATSLGLVSKIVVYVPWSMPPLLSGYLASGGDFRNVILQLILIVIGVLLYLPFLGIYEKTLEADPENVPVAEEV